MRKKVHHDRICQTRFPRSVVVGSPVPLVKRPLERIGFFDRHPAIGHEIEVIASVVAELIGRHVEHFAREFSFSRRHDFPPRTNSFNRRATTTINSPRSRGTPSRSIAHASFSSFNFLIAGSPGTFTHVPVLPFLTRCGCSPISRKSFTVDSSVTSAPFLPSAVATSSTYLPRSFTATCLAIRMPAITRSLFRSLADALSHSTTAPFLPSASSCAFSFFRRRLYGLRDRRRGERLALHSVHLAERAETFRLLVLLHPLFFFPHLVFDELIFAVLSLVVDPILSVFHELGHHRAHARNLNLAFAARIDRNVRAYDRS